MHTATGRCQAPLGLLATVVFVGVSVVGVPSGVAQTPTPEADHLKCYNVVQDTNPSQRAPVRLVTPQFNATEACTIPSTRATLFCAPTEKFSASNPQGDDPRGGPLDPQTDYLCYKVVCQPSVPRTVRVDDQFNKTPNRVLRLREALFLCTPAKKQVVPGTR